MRIIFVRHGEPDYVNDCLTREGRAQAAAAEAALKGAENSKNFVSKFGRAKSYGQKTIGTPDAGAVSMSKFFEGLAKA